MDSEIEVASVAEGPEIEVASVAEGPEIEVTSAAEGPEIGGTSSAEGPETKVRRYWKHDSSSSSDSIFRAPTHISYGRESHFVPKLVSIGPHHHGLKTLQPMEVTKVRCMSDLLKLKKRSAGGRSNFNRVPVEPFKKFETDARRFYKTKFDNITDVEFVWMLVLDSCFIIRIMLSFYPGKRMGFLEVNIKDVKSDLFLLENQIPLFFINEVYYWLFPNEPDTKIRDVIKNFIRKEYHFPWTCSDNCVDFQSDHLLDFYWKGSVPCETQFIEIMKNDRGFRQAGSNWEDHCEVTKFANATELHQTAGIKFYTYGSQIKKKEKNMGLQVEFSKGIMRMRCLNIDSSMATLLVNLIAYENSMSSSIRIISTYIKLMDHLIDSEKDVELLQKFGIMYNTLSNHTTAATFFNDTGNLCLIDNSKNPFSDLFKDVDKYYQSSCNRRWASLEDNYFNSPWAGISVFAGVILLILTVLQTWYTIYPYYYPGAN